MRAPPCFFAVAILSLFYFYRSGTLLSPSPPLKNECLRQGDDVPPLSPSSFDPPPPGPFFPFVFPDTIMVLSPFNKKKNIVWNPRSKMALVSVARWDKPKIIRPQRRGPYRWFFLSGGGAYHTTAIVESHAKKSKFFSFLFVLGKNTFSARKVTM